MCASLNRRSLGAMVRTYWEAHGEFPHVRERVLPTTDIFLLVNLGAPHFLISAQGAGVYSNAWVSGVQKSALVTGAFAQADVWGAKLSRARRAARLWRHRATCR